MTIYSLNIAQSWYSSLYFQSTNFDPDCMRRLKEIHPDVLKRCFFTDPRIYIYLTEADLVQCIRFEGNEEVLIPLLKKPRIAHKWLDYALNERNLELFTFLSKHASPAAFYRTSDEYPKSVLFQTIEAGLPFLQALGLRVKLYYLENEISLLQEALTKRDEAIVQYILQHQAESMGWKVEDSGDQIAIRFDHHHYLLHKGADFSLHYKGTEYKFSKLLSCDNGEELPQEYIIRALDRIARNRQKHYKSYRWETLSWLSYRETPSYHHFFSDPCFMFNRKGKAYCIQTYRGDVLGSGGTKEVYLGRDLNTGEPFAIGCMPTEYYRESEVKLQRRIHKHLPNSVIEPLKVIHTEEETCIISPFGGSGIQDVWRKISVDDRKDAILRIIEILQCLTQIEYCHFDVKHHNFLIKAENGRNVLKSVDYGSAKSYDQVLIDLPHKDYQDSQQLPPEFRQPPFAATKEVVRKGDVYGLGILLLELTTGTLVKVNPDIHFPEKSWQHLVKGMCASPEERFSIEKVAQIVNEMPAFSFFSPFEHILWILDQPDQKEMDLETLMVATLTEKERSALLEHSRIDSYPHLCDYLIRCTDPEEYLSSQVTRLMVYRMTLAFYQSKIDLSVIVNCISADQVEEVKLILELINNKDDLVIKSIDLKKWNAFEVLLSVHTIQDVVRVRRAAQIHPRFLERIPNG